MLKRQRLTFSAESMYKYVTKNKQKIRTLFLLGKFGSDFSGLVRMTGLEPT